MLNNTHPIEQIFIDKDKTYYYELKHIIKQADLLSKEIFTQNNNPNYNGIQLLECKISTHIVGINVNLISFINEKPYEIQRQFKTQSIFNGQVINLTYETINLSSLFKQQYLEWWETKVKQKIYDKYNGLDNANSICQFARQIRNAFGHSKINITNSKSVDPIWNNVNLKDYNGCPIFEIITYADIINFWIEFEIKELSIIK